MNGNQDNKQVQKRRGLQRRANKKSPLPSYKRGPFSWLIIIIAVMFAMWLMLQPGLKSDNISYSAFSDSLDLGKVEQVILTDNEITERKSYKI